MIKVMIFEDNRHLLESLQILLDGTPGFSCAGAYADFNDMLYHVKTNVPDVVLMDIEMPGMSGTEATAIIKAKFPQVQILIQTVFYDDQNVFKAICAGASGYILKTTHPSGYIEAIQEVRAGGSPMTPDIARRVLELFKEHVPPPSDKTCDLTEKEQTVLKHLVEGKSYKMIAGSLELSVDTVKTHIKNIYAKLHVNSGTEAVSKALRDRLV